MAKPNSPAALGAGEPAMTDLERFHAFMVHGTPGPHAYVVLLGLQTFETPALLEAVQRGFAYRMFERFLRNTGLSTEYVAALIGMPRRTLTRRKQDGRFLSGESDRLLRVARVFGRALALFEGDRAAARHWLGAPHAAFGGAIPLELAGTEVGAAEVERVILRLEHGVFS